MILAEISCFFIITQKLHCTCNDVHTVIVQQLQQYQLYTTTKLYTYQFNILLFFQLVCIYVFSGL